MTENAYGDYAIYEVQPTNGHHRIIQTVVGTQREAEHQTIEGQAVKLVPNDVKDDSHALDLSLGVIERPVSPFALDRASLAADGQDSLSITAIEPGTRIVISGPMPDDFIVPVDAITLRCLVPGEYRLRIEAPFPHVRAEVVIRGL